MTTALERIGPSESQAVAEARFRERRHADDRAAKEQARADQRAHDESRMRTGKGHRPPATLDGLLAWYATAIALEKPDKLHTAAVYHTNQRFDDQADPTVPPTHVGGSELGTRAYSDPFRRTLENSPHEVDEDGHYLRPLASAGERMRRGSRERPPAPFTVGVLSYLAHSPADWRNVGDLLNIHEEVVAIYLHRALELLWFLYRPAPPARVVTDA